MYFMLNMTEDGLRVEDFDSEQALIQEINDLTSEDIVPEYRAQFLDRVPTWTDESHFYLIMRGTVVIPKPVKTVTEWGLDD